jgi:hypothetical protein
MYLAKRVVLTIIFVASHLISLAQRGQVDRSEWMDSEDKEPSWTINIVVLLVLFGIPYLISEFIKSRDKKNKLK